jgi:manganese efflux pump family protein
MVAGALKVAVIALSLALDVFAVSIGVGIRGAPRYVKLRIGIAFATAEVSMNLIGAGIGLVAGRILGSFAGYIGFGALVALGTYMIVQSRREAELRTPLDMSRGIGLLTAAVSISLDSLGIGFSILYIGVPPVISLTAIGAVSIIATFVGLTLGHALGRRIEERAELLGGVALVLTGLAFAVLKALNVG